MSWPPSVAMLRACGLGVGALVCIVALVSWLVPAPLNNAVPIAVNDEPVKSATLTVPRLAELSLVSGRVTVDGQLVDERWAPLAAGSVVSTTTGSACLTAQPEIEVCLDAHTTVALLQLSGDETVVEVRAGLALARLTKRTVGQTFSLATEQFVATAVGTVFALRVGEQSGDVAPTVALSEVTVLEGMVRVQGTGPSDELVSVGPNTRLSKLGSAGFQTNAVVRQEASKLWSLLGREQWARTRDVGVLRVKGDGEPDISHERVYVDAMGPWKVPLALTLPQGLHELRLAGSDVTWAAEVTSGDVTVTGIGPLLPEPVAVTTAPVANNAVAHKSETSRELLQAARVALTQGQRAQARRLYRKLVQRYPSSPEAQSVRVTVGQLELESGNGRRALSAFDQYLSSGGPLAPEAQAGRVRALELLGRKREARAAMTRYLELYPTHQYASRFRQLLEQPK